MKVGFLCVTHPHCAGRARAVRALGHEIVGAFDPDSSVGQAFAKEFGCLQAETPGEILARSDFVIIEGRNSQNSALAIVAANCGVPMLLEKPGAENAARLRQVQEAVEKNGVFCQVGYHLRYSPAVQRALSFDIGRVTTARFHAAVMQPWLQSEWFTDPQDMGGMVFLDFCHMLDLLKLFLGPVSGHYSKITKLEGLPKHAFEDSAAFVLQFGDTLAAGDCCGWESNDWITTWDIELYGLEGTLKLGIHPPWTALYRQGDGWFREVDSDFDGELNYHFELQDALGPKPSLGCSIQEAVSTAEVLNQMYLAEAGLGPSKVE